MFFTVLRYGGSSVMNMIIISGEALVVQWTAGQQVERSILHMGHDS